MKKPYSFTQYQELPVWQDAHQWVLDLFQVSSQLSSDDQSTLGYLIRKKALKLPIAIADSTHQRALKDSAKYLYQAKDRVEVINYYLKVCLELKFISEKEYQLLFEKGESISKQISGWIKSKYSKVKDSGETTQ